MRPERTDVEFPLWRKKVDKSLFEHRGTTIPTWACSIWSIPTVFQDCSSRKDSNAQVSVLFEGCKYTGWVTIARHGRRTPAYRLWFGEELCLKLKRTFLMSYMRSLEKGLSNNTSADIEMKIPFWEFLDIEFDITNREFRFRAYYKQEPVFAGLFTRLIGSPSLQKIDDELEQKGSERVYKQDWKPRGELEYEIGAKNVIYFLIDTVNKLLYVGEAGDLIKRLSQGHSSIPTWDYFRYNVLPDSWAHYRVVVERMVIRDFASLMTNKRGVGAIVLSDYRLANDKIDT